MKMKMKMKIDIFGWFVLQFINLYLPQAAFRVDHSFEKVLFYQYWDFGRLHSELDQKYFYCSSWLTDMIWPLSLFDEYLWNIRPWIMPRPAPAGAGSSTTCLSAADIADMRCVQEGAWLLLVWYTLLCIYSSIIIISDVCVCGGGT